MQEIVKKRANLEKFLFNENSKISKPSIRFILDKWAKLGGKLHKLIIENEVLRHTQQPTEMPTYAQMVMAETSYRQQTQQRAASKEGTKITKQDAGKVIIIKPEKMKDKRTSEEIKMAATKRLQEYKDIRVNSIRQTRQNGIIIHVKGDQDISLINKANMQAIGLRVDKPKQLDPYIIIYDVEKNWIKKN